VTLAGSAIESRLQLDLVWRACYGSMMFWVWVRRLRTPSCSGFVDLLHAWGVLLCCMWIWSKLSRLVHSGRIDVSITLAYILLAISLRCGSFS